MPVSDEIAERVATAFHRAGVEIPYAKRDLYIRTMPAEASFGAAPALQPAPGLARGDSDE